MSPTNKHPNIISSSTDPSCPYPPPPADRLSLRRRPHPAEMDRIHRNRKGLIGPDLVQWNIDKIHSDALAHPSAHSTHHYGLHFSVNRQKRWELEALEDFDQFQTSAENVRVSRVIQAINPQSNAPSIDNSNYGLLEETNVIELCSKGGRNDVDVIYRRRNGAGSGANKLAQLFQKGSQQKKGRNPRRGRGLEEGIPVEEESPWMNLFGKDNGRGAKTKTKKSGRNRADEKEGNCANPKMHIYYTISRQKPTQHQLDSGWQQRGRRREREFNKKNNGRKFTNRLDLDGKYSDEIDSMEEEEEEDYYDGVKPKLTASTSAKKEKGCRLERNKMAPNESEQKRRPKNWCLDTIGPAFQAEEEEEEEGIIELEDWPDERLLEKFASASKHSPLPLGTAIYAVNGDELGENMLGKGKEGKMDIPVGSLLIRRNGMERTKWYLNLASTTEEGCEMTPSGTSDSADRPSTKHRLVRMKLPIWLKKMKQPLAHRFYQESQYRSAGANAEFFQDLLRNGDKKRHRLNMELLENLPLTEMETGQKALELVLCEQTKAAFQRRKHKENEGDDHDDSAVYSIDSTLESSSSSNGSDCDGPNFCEVCFVECKDLAVDGFALASCGPAEHVFCNACWRRHIKQCLVDGKVPITCMDPRCASILHPDCALLVVGQHRVEQYCQLLSDRRRMSKDFLSCPRCQQMHYLKKGGLNEAEASGTANRLTICDNCANVVCTDCGRRQHLPLNCQQRDLYEPILQANGQSLSSLVHKDRPNMATGVRCKKCRNLVEKNNGCDHMTCRCGHQFCWMCGDDWPHQSQCDRSGQITVPLFDNNIFINPKTGNRFRRMPRYVHLLANMPEKFIGEYAKIRAPREENGVKLFLILENVFGDELEAEKWTIKYMQLAEFVELSLVKARLEHENAPLAKNADKLMLNFTSLLLMANLESAQPRDELPISREMVEAGYTEMMALCRQMLRC